MFRITIEVGDLADLPSAIADLAEHLGDGEPGTVAIGTPPTPATPPPPTVGATPATPPPPAPPTGPAVEVPAGDLPGAAVELDSAGYPWNEGIHAGTKTKKADGTWKPKRGADVGLIQRTRAEWDSANPAPATPSSPTPATPAGHPLAAAAAAGNSAAPAQSDDVTTCVRLASAATASAGADDGIRREVSVRINAAMSESGLSDMQSLINNPEHAPTVLGKLQQLCHDCGLNDDGTPKA